MRCKEHCKEIVSSKHIVEVGSYCHMFVHSFRYVENADVFNVLCEAVEFELNRRLFHDVIDFCVSNEYVQKSILNLVYALIEVNFLVFFKDVLAFP